MQRIVRFLLIALLSGNAGVIYASGFELSTQNVTNLGTAYAGTASEASDVTTEYYNAAGLTRLCHDQFAVSLVYYKPTVRVEAGTGLSSQGVSFGPFIQSAGTALVLPSFHYSYHLDDCTVFGLGWVTPYAYKYNFGENGFAQFVSTRSELRTYDLTPSIAWVLCNDLSIGVGLDFVYADVKNDFNIGSNITSPVGFVHSVQNRWGIGVHAGILWEIDCMTRVGLNWRSSVHLSLKGETDFLTPPSVTISETVIPTHSTLNLPATLTLSGFHHLDHCWALMMDIQWTHWKKFHKVRLDLGEFGQITTLEDFRDTYRVAIGSVYQFNECTRIRFGVAYDRSPVRDSLRNLMIPDSDRTWLSCGLQYVFPCVRVELGYAHLFHRYQTINQGAPTLTNFPVVLNSGVFGIVKTHTNIFGIQFTKDI